jgi:hypothetical protein
MLLHSLFKRYVQASYGCISCSSKNRKRPSPGVFSVLPKADKNQTHVSFLFCHNHITNRAICFVPPEYDREFSDVFCPSRIQPRCVNFLFLPAITIGKDLYLFYSYWAQPRTGICVIPAPLDGIRQRVGSCAFSVPPKVDHELVHVSFLFLPKTTTS